jgi:hypothetical protein
MLCSDLNRFLVRVYYCTSPHGFHVVGVAGRRKSHTLPHNISTYQEDRERFVAPEFNTLKMTRYFLMLD